MSDPAAMAPLRVLYDDECGLCRRLAEYGRTRSEGHLEFTAWHEFAATDEAARHFDAAALSGPAAHLRAIRDGAVFEDQDAWAAILAAYPPFEKFAWIVARIGLMGPVSRATYHAAQWARGRCATCP